MPIRYKVVDGGRNSCFVYHSLFCLKYNKGQEIKAKKNSVGIFVFDSLQNAERFMNASPIDRERKGWHVIRVKALGTGKRLYWRPTSYKNHNLYHFNDVFKKFKSFIRFNRGPKFSNYQKVVHHLEQRNDGTMLYQAVVPLD